jgi:hypothetical protein
MADKYVREVGRVEDESEAALIVGVDYDTVTIQGRHLTASQAEEFGALFVSAVWQAAQQQMMRDG